MSLNCHVILVGPKDTANVGAIARVMKNFGFENLRIASRKTFNTKRARMLSCSAEDVLNQAKSFPTLEDALADITFAIGFTRRSGWFRTTSRLEDTLPKIKKRLAAGEKIALVFGREDKGLSDAEAKLCHRLVHISTRATCPSMNVAQAATIALYNLASRDNCIASQSEEKIATRKDVDAIISDIEEVLCAVGYTSKVLRKKILSRWRKIFGRAGLNPADIGMMRGLLGKNRR